MGCGASSAVAPGPDPSQPPANHGAAGKAKQLAGQPPGGPASPEIKSSLLATATDQQDLIGLASNVTPALGPLTGKGVQASQLTPLAHASSNLGASLQPAHEPQTGAVRARVFPLPGAIQASASDPGQMPATSPIKRGRLAPLAATSPLQSLMPPMQQPEPVLEQQPATEESSGIVPQGPAVQDAPPTPELMLLTPRQSNNPPPAPSTWLHGLNSTRTSPIGAAAAAPAAPALPTAPSAHTYTVDQAIKQLQAHSQAQEVRQPISSRSSGLGKPAAGDESPGSPSRSHVRFAGPGAVSATDRPSFKKPPPLVIGGDTGQPGIPSKSPATITPVDQAISVLQQRVMPLDAPSMGFDEQLIQDLVIEHESQGSGSDSEGVDLRYNPKSPFQSNIFQRVVGTSAHTSPRASQDGLSMGRRISSSSSSGHGDDDDDDDIGRGSGLSMSGMHIAGATGQDLVARALLRNIRRLTFDGATKETNTGVVRAEPVCISNRSVTHCAVSLAFLLDFSQQVPADMTTLEVVYKIIVPETTSFKCRYADYIDAEHTSLPHYFVSHRWAAPFSALVSALFLYFDCNNLDAGNVDPANTFLWIDVFAVNQHPGAEQVGDLANLQDALTAAESGTLMCLDEKGLVLTRIWCLYEIHHTIRLKGTQGLRVLAADVKYAELRDIFNSLDASRAQATVEEDRQRILNDIQATTGIDALNQGIKEALVESCLLEAQNLQSSRNNNTAMFVAAHYKAGQILRVAGRYADAEAYLNQTIEVYDHGLGVRDKQCAVCLVSLGTLKQEQGRYAEAERLCWAGLQLTESLLKDAVAKYRTGGEEIPGVDVTVADVMYAYTALGSVLQAQGKFSAALPYFEKALATCKEVMGKAHPDTTTAMQALAGLLLALGRSKDALKLLRKAVVLREEHLGQDHPLTAVTYDALGVVLQQRGAFGEAEPLFLKALDVRRQRLGDDHPAVGVSMHNLGSLMADQARAEEAEAFYLAALSVREAALGLGHPASASTLNNLAALYKESGRVDEAVPLLQHALEARTQALGPEHPATSSCMNNLATLLLEKGHLEDAQPLYLEHVRVLEKVLGPDHADVAMALENYATCLKAAGQVDEACSIFKRALRILEAAVGDGHPDVAHCAANLAQLLQEQGDVFEAGRLFNRALSIQTKVHGPKHKGNIQLLHALGAMAAKEGDLSKAQEMFNSAISLCRQLNTESASRPQSAITSTSKRASDHLLNISRKVSLTASNTDAPGLTTRQSSVALLSRISTRSHSGGQSDVLLQLATNLNDLGNVLLDCDQLDEAKKAFTEALELRDSLLGDDHVNTAIVKENLACLLLETGEHHQAELLLKDVLDCNLLLPPANQGPAALSAYNLGRALEAQGKLKQDEARQAYEQGVQIAEAALGAAHPDTIQYKENLAAFVKAAEASASSQSTGGKRRRRRKKAVEADSGDEDDKD